MAIRLIIDFSPVLLSEMTCILLTITKYIKSIYKIGEISLDIINNNTKKHS